MKFVMRALSLVRKSKLGDGMNLAIRSLKTIMRDKPYISLDNHHSQSLAYSKEDNRRHLEDHHIRQRIPDHDRIHQHFQACRPDPAFDIPGEAFQDRQNHLEADCHSGLGLCRSWETGGLVDIQTWDEQTRQMAVHLEES